MLHTMPSGRCDAFNKGSRNGSFGCVNLPDEVLNYRAKTTQPMIVYMFCPLMKKIIFMNLLIKAIP